MTTFRHDLTADEPVVLDAGYEFDKAERRRIDEQIRDLQNAALDGFMRGTVTAWFVVSHDTDLIRGDVVCLAGSSAPGGERRVTKATAAARANAGTPVGIVIAEAPKGASVHVAIAGVVHRDVTGLPADSPGPVRVNAEGRCVRVSPPGDGDVLLGSTDAAGALAMAHGRGGNVYADFVTLEGEVAGPSNASYVAKLGGIPVALAGASNGQIPMIEDGEWKAKPLPAPPIPTAAQVTFDPGSTGLPDKVQGAILAVNAKAENPPGANAKKIQDVDVSTTAPTVGQSLVANSATPGVYVPRYTGTSRVVVIETSGPHSAQPGDILIIKASVAGDVDIRLPVSPGIGAPVQVKRMSANAALVTVDGMGGKIDGDNAISIKPHEAATLRYYAAGEWARLGKCEAVSQGSVRHLGLEYDPIALWKLDGDLLDSSGNGLHLTVSQSNAGYVTPTGGFACLYLSGANSSTNNATYLSALSSLPDITIQAIVNIGFISGGLPEVIRCYSTGGAVPRRFALALSATSTQFVYRNAANTADVTVSAPAVPRGSWAHVCATRRVVDNLSVIRIYINGAKVAEVTDREPPYAVSSNVVVMLAANVFGMLASTKIIPRALDDIEVYAEAQKAGRAA